MSPPYHLSIAIPELRELARIYHNYRLAGKGQVVTRASNLIERFLRHSPEGGHPLPGDRYRIWIYPLRYIYSIDGDEVIVHLIEEAPA